MDTMGLQNPCWFIASGELEWPEELERDWSVRKHSSEWRFSWCSVSVWKVSQDRFQGRGYQGYHLKGELRLQCVSSRIMQELSEAVSKAPDSVIDASHSKKIWHSISRLKKQKQLAHWASTVFSAWGVPGIAWEFSKHDLTVTQFCRMGIASYAPRCHGLNCESVCPSVVLNSLWLHGLEPTNLLCPWNSLGKNTGVGSHSLLLGIFPTQGSNPGLLHCRLILYRLSHQGSLNCCEWSCSVMSNSLQSHGLWPARLLHPWNFPGKDTGMGCHFLLWVNCCIHLPTKFCILKPHPQHLRMWLYLDMEVLRGN